VFLHPCLHLLAAVDAEVVEHDMDCRCLGVNRQQPLQSSCDRLIGAQLMELHETWLTQDKAYFNMEQTFSLNVARQGHEDFINRRWTRHVRIVPEPKPTIAAFTQPHDPVIKRIVKMMKYSEPLPPVSVHLTACERSSDFHGRKFNSGNNRAIN